MVAGIEPYPRMNYRHIAIDLPSKQSLLKIQQQRYYKKEMNRVGADVR